MTTPMNQIPNPLKRKFDTFDEKEVELSDELKKTIKEIRQILFKNEEVDLIEKSMKAISFDEQIYKTSHVCKKQKTQ